MTDFNFSEFILFNGQIKLNEKIAAVTFKACIDKTGEVELEFEKMPINAETKFIEDNWQGNARSLGVFCLSGIAENGTKISSDKLSFMGLRSSWEKTSGRWMSPVASSSQILFSRRLTTTSNLPALRIRLKGFQAFRRLIADCELGTIAMEGPSKIEEPNLMSGLLLIQAKTVPDDLDAWRTRADKLLDHIRRIMSFASANVLRSPILEFFNYDELELTAYSQTNQTSSSMRTVHYLHQEDIFEAAVSSFFNPAIKVKNLFYAIEWFTMDATYNEVRLVNAMTVLENLVASNLDQKDELFLPTKEFDKTRKVLRQVLRDCVGKWSSDNKELTDEIVNELNERLNDLNRKSILKKLNILLQLWAVPMNGISTDQLKEAKRARDMIVHRGHYYDDDEEKSDVLWDHLMLIRELVVRIIFTAINYQGSYISFVGGMHHTNFPPKT